ncbi:MAG: PAS domain S-box protein, partial [Rhodospirillales bacterium]|nr:PAS domain S-box protein [Rhodospirillales bacterium]
DAGLADLVLPPARIGGALADIMRGSRKRTVSGVAAQPKRELDALLTVLSHKSNCEFSQYKESTLTRRIERRMAVHKLANLKAYTALVKKSDTEAELLFKDILISVTAFFRDEDTFKALRQAVKEIVARKSRGEDVRIWVPGCATGEEVFSIAILLAEALGQKLLSTPVQIFATDIDAGAIAFARRGLYLETSTKTVPSRLLKKYFTRTGGMYQVVKKIRDMVVFARHDLIRDPPYINLDLVSCRNVLIYFRRPLQDRLVPLFHYSLKPGGYLALGLSEGIGKFTHLFEPFNQRGKVFGRIGEVRSLHAVLQSPHVSHQHAERPQPRPEGAISLRDHYRDLVAEAYAPAGVLVNGRFEIVHVQGDVTRFVHLPPGDLNVNVMNMAIAPLNLETRLVLQKAQREHVVVRGHPVELKDERGISRITTIAIPAMAEANAGRHTLLLFEERRIAEPTEAAERSEEDTDAIRIKELEQELIATREQLQTSVEELQSSNEDLQSVNEEYQSTAEELQSANEELQTTNEELQSTNEELRAVNDELKMKSAALESTNMDLENILDTALSGIVVLDRDHRVARYSEASKQVFDLFPTSIGKRLVAIGSPFDLTLLSAEIERVTKTGVQVDRELALGGRIFSVRLIPLFEEGTTPSGTVITFSDDTDRIRAEQDVRRLATVVEDSNDAIAVLDLDGKILTWNHGAESMYGYTEAEARELTISDLVPERQQARMFQLIEQLVGGEKVASFESKRRTKDGRVIDAWLTATLLRDEDGIPNAVATTERDLTEIKRLVAEKEIVRLADQDKSQFLARVSHELRTPLNAILGFSEIIKNELFGPVAQRRYVAYGQDIHSSGQYLLALVNDILDLSKIEEHEFQLEDVVLDLHGLAEEMIHMLSLEANKQGISLSIDTAAELPKLKSDRRAIQQILLNLLNNAIKFTPSGGRIILEMRMDHDGNLRLAVCDTGIGIAEKDIPEVMKPFTQIPNRLETEQMGTGLGLPIAKGLAELLGTELEIASEVGSGTTVTMRFGKARLVW